MADSAQTDAVELSPVEHVPVSALVGDDTPRLSGVDAEHLRLLIEIGPSLPPITVHRATMRVIDGVHRLRAAGLRGDETIATRFFDGDEHTAFMLGVQSNLNHGLPLTSADREAAVRRILRTRPHWSNRAIAAVSGFSAKTVAAIRQRATGESAELHTRTGLDGRVRPVDAAAGRRRASELISKNPKASLRQIARSAGVSPGTVRDVRKRLQAGLDPVARPTTRSARTPRRPAPRARTGIENSVITTLRHDPALRFSERGRKLLQLFDAHTRNVHEWDQLADAVPAHWAEAVSDLAHQFAVMWQDFAGKLESSEHDNDVTRAAR